MLTIAPSMKPGRVIQGPARPGKVKRESRAEKLKRLAEKQAEVKKRAFWGKHMQLPWPEFLAVLRRRRDANQRAHIRWCMRAAIRNCESLKRAEGRAFELRPGGRHNIVARGGMWFEGKNGPERVHYDDASATYKHGRYLNELEDNLRKLLCPDWAIPVVRRAVRIKLAQGWDLSLDGDVIPSSEA